MKAIIHQGVGGPEVLTLADRPTPDPGPGQVRVAVRAAGLNRADILQRRGGYAAPPGWPEDIPGLEYAGEVDAVGPGVSRWKTGDRVMGLVGGGGHAGAVVVHQDETMPIPAGLSFAEAAAIPEAFLTGFDALVFRGRVASGDRVLIHAAASGLGTATAQLARWMGATVLGTSRSPEKLGRLREYGVDLAIDTSAGGFREAVNPPVQVVIDVLGGPALADNLAVLAANGRLVLLGFLQGPEVATSLAPVLRKRLEVIGTIMRARPLEERIPLVQAFVEQVLAGFEGAGGPPALRPVVGAVYPMERIADAHRAMEGNATFGKLILEW